MSALGRAADRATGALRGGLDRLTGTAYQDTGWPRPPTGRESQAIARQAEGKAARNAYERAAYFDCVLVSDDGGKTWIDRRLDMDESSWPDLHWADEPTGPEPGEPDVQPLADWAQENCPPDHHVEIPAAGVPRFVADTPEIAARDEAEHQAAAEFCEQTGFYVAPDGWDEPEPDPDGLGAYAAETSRSDREAGQ